MRLDVDGLKASRVAVADKGTDARKPGRPAGPVGAGPSSGRGSGGVPLFDWPDWEERAAIMEHEGRLSREYAEKAAALACGIPYATVLERQARPAPKPGRTPEEWRAACPRYWKWCFHCSSYRARAGLSFCKARS